MATDDPAQRRMGDFEHMARGLESAADETGRYDLAVGAAVSLVAGCDHAGVTVVERGRYVTEAASDDVARQGDLLQYELDEGPCVDSVRDHETVLSLDLPNDPRWPRWGPEVHRRLGIGSMLSLLLYTHDSSFGALNLYGRSPAAFSPDDQAVARALAGHVAVAVAAGREIGQLGVAIRNRTVIGQAEGILMERLNVDAEAAFAYLRRVSQDLNLKLVAVAEEIVTTRQLPVRTPQEG